MKIFITKRATKKFYAIKEYIAEEWGELVAGTFEQKTVEFFDLLEKFPEMGSVEVSDKGIRGFQLTKQTRIFYRIKGERIIILTFFDVRQHPKKTK